MRTKSRPNIFLVAAGVMLSLVLISVHFSSGMYARFVTSASGSDRGRIAGLRTSAVMEQATDESGEPIEGSYRLTVRNERISEVTVSCSVEIVLEEGTAARISSVSLGEETVEAADIQDDKVVFENVAVLSPGKEETPVLSFVLNSRYDDPDQNQNNTWQEFSNDELSVNEGECPFAVHVGFRQVD